MLPDVKRAHQAVRDAYGTKQVRYDIKVGGFWEDFDHQDRGGFSLHVPDGGVGHREIYGSIFPMCSDDVRRMVGAAFRETAKTPILSVETYVARFSPIENLTQLVTALRCMLFRVKATNITGHSA